MTERYAGVDLGANSISVALIEDRANLLHVVGNFEVAAGDSGALAAALGDTTAVAIDAPSARSTRPHEGDERLAPKFRRARCGEVAMRFAGIAVPFVSPAADDDLPGWMAVGFATWAVARAVAPSVIETFPHGIFWRLAGRPVLHKQRQDGRAARVALLAQRVVFPDDEPRLSHDQLDATACALLAALASRGEAERLDCGADREWATHDGSAIWLPRRPDQAD